MGHNWIIDVLVDLKTFADQNRLPDLAEELDRVAGFARTEIDATTDKGAQAMARSDHPEPRRVSSPT